MQVGIGKRRGFAGSGLGFTLIELLVVVAIIAIIAAIMFPVIGKAKEQAKIAECLSNMKQIGVALHMYTNDYSSRFPNAVPVGIPWKENEATVQELLSPYLRTGIAAQKLSNIYIYPNKTVFCCPSDIGIIRRDDGYCGIRSGKSVWIQTGCSYRYYADNQPDYLRRNYPQVPWSGLSPEVVSSAASAAKFRLGAPESAVVNQARKAIIGDMWFWHLGDQVPPDNNIAFCNTLFVDGHAARVNGIAHVESRTATLTKYWHTYTETGY